jgi:L-alanine-DL-glutamate epimerase-like enolase superfamily enzyme
VRLERATVTVVGGPLRRPAFGASSTWGERYGRCLRLVDADGFVGVGEASPLPGYSPDTDDEAAVALERFAAGLPMSLRGPAAGETSGAAVLRQLDECPEVRAASASARHAIETATLDLLGRRCGLPVHQLLSSPPERAIALAALVPAGAGADAATRLARQGFEALKVKVGDPFDARLPAIRRAAAGCSLRIDAGRCFDAAAVGRWAPRIAQLGPELVEEPMPLAGLTAPPALPFPLALDESLQDERTAARAVEWIERGLVRVLVLKPMALGGFGRCLDLAHAARGAGGDVVVSHLFDGTVAFAAAAELALALGGSRAAGLAPHAGLSAYPAGTSPALGATGTTLGAHQEPGLGISQASSATRVPGQG